MITPNALAGTFTDWMLNISFQPLTSSQRALFTTIYNASQTATPVTNQVFNNYIQASAWRYPFFRVYFDTKV